MNNVYTIVLALSNVLVCSKAGVAQDALAVKRLEITVQAIDGRNGKALAHQRLLISTGMSRDDVKTHAAHVELTTDKEGMGTLSLIPPRLFGYSHGWTVELFVSKSQTKIVSASMKYIQRLGAA